MTLCRRGRFLTPKRHRTYTSLGLTFGKNLMSRRLYHPIKCEADAVGIFSLLAQDGFLCLPCFFVVLRVLLFSPDVAFTFPFPQKKHDAIMSVKRTPTSGGVRRRAAMADATTRESVSLPKRWCE